MSAHEGENTHATCNQCDSKFSLLGHLKTHKLSVHEGIKYSCNQCGSNFSQQGSLKTHKVSVHEGANTYVINVIQNSVCHVTTRHRYSCTQCVSNFRQQGSLKTHKLSVHEGTNAHEINVTKKLDGKVSSRPIKCLYMKESHTHAINVTIKLIVKVTSIVLQNSFGNKHCQHQNWFYFPKWS